MASKYLVPALAAISTAYAASCSTSATMTIQNQGDASAIGACSTFSGSIAVQTGAGNSLDFGNVQDITGNLVYADDANIQTISANSLQNLGGLTLTNLSGLSALNLEALDTVGNIDIEGLGSLGTFNFGQGISKAKSVSIVNTQVSALTGISTATQLTDLVVSDNQYLSNISFNVMSVGVVNIGPNNVQQGQSIDFPQLAMATSLTFRNSSSVSTPMLMNVSQTLGLYGNTMQSYSASNLTWVGALVFADNSAITNISFPALVNINGSNATLQVANNSKLSNINGFPKLKSVSGNVELFGAINNVSFGSINNIAGALAVDTSSSNFDCGAINDLSSSQVVKGKTTCHSNDANPTGTTTGGDGSSGTDSGSSSSTSSGAAVPLELPAFMTGAGLFTGLLALLI